MRFVAGVCICTAVLLGTACRTVKTVKHSEEIKIDSSKSIKKDVVVTSARQEKKSKVELKDITLTAGSWDDLNALRAYLKTLEGRSADVADTLSIAKKKGAKRRKNAKAEDSAGLLSTKVSLHIGSAIITEETANTKDSTHTKTAAESKFKKESESKDKDKQTDSPSWVPLVLVAGLVPAFLFLIARVKLYSITQNDKQDEKED